MQYFRSTILCIEYDEFVGENAIIQSKSTYDSLKRRDQITVHGVGGNGRSILIEFETLPQKYKDAVKEQYGDPYLYISKQPILNSLEWDSKAHSFYNGYELPNGDKLPNTDKDLRGKTQINHVHRYTQNASWLNMLGRLTTDKPALKRELNISIAQFWETATDVIGIKKVALPRNAKRLKAKLKEYQEGSYEVLIEKHKFGNNHSSKIADEVSEAFLKELVAHKNNHDDTVVSKIYNKWATDNDRQVISAGTVGYRRKQWANELMYEREGVGKLASKISKNIHRDRASAPLLFVGSDDNILDAFWINGDNKWFRPALYVVIDNYNDYILGYAWGESITKDLIKDAYRNAQRHVMELTGESYSWQQLQTDRWGISGKNTTELEEFYNSMGHFTPAGLKNAKSKYIEASFGTVWHQVLKMFFPNNYSGYNVGSKSKINKDAMQPANFPHISEADTMIGTFIEAMRRTKFKDSGLSREQQWLQAFNTSDKSKKKLLSDAERLQIFGKTHSHTNQITNNGIMPTLLGSTIKYELSQQQIMEHNGKRVQVIYDEYDLSKVLITDSKGLRLVASTYENVPGAFADYLPGDAARIKALQAEKKTLLPSLQKGIEQRKEILQRARIDAESRLQAGVLTKEINHEDIRLLSGNSTESDGILHKVGAEAGGVCAENDTKQAFKNPLKAVKQARNNYYDEY